LSIGPPGVPVVLNTTGDVATDERSIRGAIVDQLTCTVEWSASMRTMRELGVDHLIEIGDSKTLVSLARLQDRRGWRCSTLASLGPAIEDPTDGCVAALNG
jgi:malonyl CoA-acyl carrier protein transacylase